MATFYLDPVGGNDANDGTTFANRWQTYTSGATAARIAPGDTIRVIASPDPTDMGQNATWTNNGQTVVLTTAVTADVYASGTWTAATTNVTLTTSTNRKIGTNCVSISPLAAFTTGKAAYRTISVTDFSAYQQISFSINMLAGTMAADGDITLRLCSDTTGDVTVNTISVPRIRSSGTWQAYTVDLGGALGSSIQSVALYVAVDNGAQTFLLNNILACKASSAVDGLTLNSRIGKNTGTDPWMGIYSISGTTVNMEFNQQGGQPNVGNKGGYYGTTATQTAYKREQLNLPSAIVGDNATNFFGTIQDSGSAGSPITFSGGWNRTDMSTQTGDTYINGVNNRGQGFLLTGRTYINIDKINVTRFQYGIFSSSAGGLTGYINYTAKDLLGNATNSTTTTGIVYSGQNSTFNIDNISLQDIQTNWSGSATLFKNTFNITTLNGSILIAGPINTATGTANNAVFNQVYNIDTLYYSTSSAGNNSVFLQIYGVDNSIFNINTIAKAYLTDFIIIGASSGGSISSTNNLFKINTISSGAFASSSTSGSGNRYVYITNGLNNVVDFNNNNISVISASGGNSYFVKSENTSTNNIIRNVGTVSAAGVLQYVYEIKDSAQMTALNVAGYTLVSGATLTRYNGTGDGNITFANYANTTTDQRIYYYTDVGNILTDTTTRHTASGISWKMSCGSTGASFSPTATFPLMLPVAKIACNASALVTASVWVYRTSTSLTTKFVCPGGQIAGVPSDVVATASAAINTWEQLTITFTPSQQGVVELEVQCYGAAASVYVDDFSVSQA